MKSSWLINLLKVAVGFVLIACIFYFYWEPKQLPSGKEVPGLKNIFDNPVRILPLVLTAFFSVSSLLLTLVRWHLLVRALDIPFRLYDALRLGLIGYTFNTILPSSVGGDFVKGYAIYREHPERRGAALSTILIDRIVGLVAMFWIVSLVGGYFWLAGDPIVVGNRRLQNLLLIPIGLAAASLILWILMGLLSDGKAELAVRNALGGIPKVGPSLAAVWDTVRLYRKRPRAIFMAFLICLASCTGWVLAYHCASLAFRVSPDPNDVATFGEHLLICPTGMALEAFVPTPGGVGGGEAFFGGLYILIGKPETVGIVMRFTVRIINFAVGLMGYLIALRMKRSELIPTPIPPVAGAETGFVGVRN